MYSRAARTRAAALLHRVAATLETGAPGLLERVLLAGVLGLGGLLRLGLGLLAGLLLLPASLGRSRRGARCRAFACVEVALVTVPVVVADRTDGGSLRRPAGRFPAWQCSREWAMLVE